MNILIVDDHPMIAEAYMNAIGQAYLTESIIFNVAYNCRDAYDFTAKALFYDIAIIDYRLPPFHEKNLFCGTDLALEIRKKMPQCKIIIITAHTEVLMIYDIFKKACPDALLIKNDVKLSMLPGIIKDTAAGNQYLSPTAKKCISDIWMKGLMVEDYNRQILMHLSKGYRVKDLGNVIHLAQSTIQKRVIHMKKAFDVADDNSLIREAIKQGFI